ncbi:SAM-dependent methyltransferase, partial [Escherichia coli]|nr:SAM-dependent methyltransferase [Escherichia coli]
FIDASELFKKETNNNILTDAHIEQIMQVFASKEDVAHLAKSVAFETVVANAYTLSVSCYVQAEFKREIINIAEINAELKTTV